MEKYRNSEVAEKLEIPHTKVKRFSRELFGPDSRATMRSGYAREHTLREAFKIYLGVHLVSALNFTVFDVRQILSDLDLWLEIKDLYPDLKQKDDSGLKVLSWTIHIFNEITGAGLQYEAIGTISLKNKRKANRNVKNKLYLQEPIIASKTPGSYVYNDLNIRVLRISLLKETFKLRMEGKNPADHFEKLTIHQ